MSDEPIRASFSIDRHSRRAIKELSGRYGLNQGDIVSFAPALFAAVAEASLAKRRRALPMIHELIGQANRSLASISSVAPHLEWVVQCVIDVIEGIERVERHSIENRKVLGVDDYDFAAAGLEDVCAEVTPVATMSRNWEAIPLMEAVREIAEGAGAEIHADHKASFIAAFDDLNLVASAASRNLEGWLSPEPTSEAAYAKFMENSLDDDSDGSEDDPR